MRTLKQIDLTSGLMRPVTGEEIVRVEDGEGNFVGFYSWSERTRSWVDTGLSSSSAISGIAVDSATATDAQMLVARPSTSSTTTVVIPCTGHGSIPAGTMLRSSTYAPYQVTVGGTSSSGSVTVTVSGSGSKCNVSAGATLTLYSPQSYNVPFTASNSGGDLLLTFQDEQDRESGTRIQVSTTSALPTGLSASTDYYLIRITSTTAKVATSYANYAAGTAIAYTDAGTGYHQFLVQTVAPTVTGSNSGGDLLLTFADFIFWTGTKVVIAGSSMPGGLTSGSTYYLIRVSSSTAKVATSLANAQNGTAIAYSSAGSGTITMTKQLQLDGTVQTQISGLVDEWAAVAREVTYPRVLYAWKYPNGDARPGIYVDDESTHSWGLQSFFDEARSGDILDIGQYYYHWNTETAGAAIEIAPHRNGSSHGFTIRGATDRQNTLKSRLYFKGVTPKLPCFWVACSDIKVMDMTLQCDDRTSTYSWNSILEVSSTNGTNFTITNNKFYRLTIYRGPSAGSGTLGRAVGVGTAFTNAGNLENMLFEDLSVTASADALVEIGPGGQPYRTILQRPKLSQAWTGPRGVGVKISGISASVDIYSPDFQNLESMLYVTQGCKIIVDGGESEHCKKQIYAPVSGNVPVHIVWKGGRYNTGDIGTASVGPVGFLAGNKEWIYSTAGGSITLDGLYTGVYDTGITYRVDHSTLTLIGGCHANTNPFYASSTFTDQAKVFSFGAQSTNGVGAIDPIPDRFGCLSAPGSFTVSGASTTATVTLSNTEPDATYIPRLTFTGSTGTPAAGSEKARLTSGSRTTTQFGVTLDVAPGVGNSVTFFYELVRS